MRQIIELQERRKRVEEEERQRLAEMTPSFAAMIVKDFKNYSPELGGTAVDFIMEECVRSGASG